jgi:hypothetical protein
VRGARAPREAEENGGAAAAAATTATPPANGIPPSVHPAPPLPACEATSPVAGKEQDERDGPFRRRPRRRWVLVVSEFGAKRD